MDPLNVRMDADLTCRQWLVTHGYTKVAAVITLMTAKWKRQGKSTRRDWWLVLAGTEEGESRFVDDMPFPVLKAARRRQGFPPDVEGAIENSPHELAPAIRRQKRWGKGFKRALR